MLKRTGGFSFVELIMVLAISGVFVMVVLIVLPQVQRGRRDAQRKAYLLLVAGKLDRYKESVANQYRYPPSNAIFNSAFQPPLAAYAVTDKSRDPSTGAHYSMVTSPPTSTAQIGQIFYTNATCTGNVGTSTNFYSLTIYLEADSVHCIDNH